MCLKRCFERCYELHKDPVNLIAHLLGAIVVIYGLWMNYLEWILIGILIAVIGHIFEEVKKKGKIKAQKREKPKSKRKRKKGALEMSVGTIVIMVIAVTMLILGIVFVRSVMCSAMGLTGEINNQVEGEIKKLFGSTGAEVQCLGSGDAVKMVPGQTNTVYCGIKAPKTAEYSVELTSYSGTVSTKEDIQSWIIGAPSWTGSVSPSDEIPKKVIRLSLPEESPEETLMLQVAIKKDGKLISTQDLDFEVSRVGFVKAAMC